MTIREAARRFCIGRSTLSKMCNTGKIPTAKKIVVQQTLRWEIPENLRIVKDENGAYICSIPEDDVSPLTRDDCIDAFIWLHQADMTVAEIMRQFQITHERVMESMDRGLERIKAGIDPFLGSPKGDIDFWA